MNNIYVQCFLQGEKEKVRNAGQDVHEQRTKKKKWRCACVILLFLPLVADGSRAG